MLLSPRFERLLVEWYPNLCSIFVKCERLLVIRIFPQALKESLNEYNQPFMSESNSHSSYYSVDE